MYKVVSNGDGRLGPAFNIGGKAFCGGVLNKQFELKAGHNDAKRLMLWSSGDSVQYSSGYHLFKNERDAKQLQNMIKRVIKKLGREEWGTTVLAVTVRSPKHITASGKELPKVVCGLWESETGKRKKTVYVASRIHIKKKNYDEAVKE